MNREEIKAILPHREPMLLVDSAELVGEGEVQGVYTVRGDEFFLQGHFPGNPIVPGVIQCEIMAQTCCALICGGEDMAKKNTFFTSLDKVRFRQVIKPGDRMDITCKLNRRKGPFFFASGQIHVNGKLAAAAEFSFALTDK
ncbi:MAG: beta-hydroxyacyl-ACP dehydratase [Oscillospiraceae bacterium]|nr:beta-hydroxyacyl-ACP dehydratase [Oscillospiraceae bacterium]